mmetsp:Transcript_21446/g.32566  ORF Transcript_21446/g.32566 Transcript_21446/m.32566 type:complete len:133 (-) Transcript_21446:92-490(-)
MHSKNIPSAYIPEGVEIPQFSFLQQPTTTTNNKCNITGSIIVSSVPDRGDGNRYFLGTKSTEESSTTTATTTSSSTTSFVTDVPEGMMIHKKATLGCDCGCVPAIPTLFEMAELRKQAKALKEKQQQNKDST